MHFCDRPSLDGPTLKVERAKEHIRNLESAIDRFLQSNPYEVICYQEPETNDRVFRVRILAQPPLRLSGIIGDIIQNLRSSLDYLAWQLVLANGGRPNERTGFPISKSANEFEAKGRGKIKGASEEAVCLIEALKPYAGGNDVLWRLHQLSIVDKHRLLVPVGTAHRNIIQDFSVLLRNLRPDWDIPPIQVALNPADRQFPLKDGAEVYRIKAQALDPQVDMNPQFTFEIAFGEGEIVQGEPVLPTLHQVVNFVEKTIDIFAPFFEIHGSASISTEKG